MLVFNTLSCNNNYLIMNIYKNLSLSSRYNFKPPFIPRATLTCFASPPPQKPPYILFILAAITIKLINDIDDNGPATPASQSSFATPASPQQKTLNNFIGESFYLKDFKT